MKVKTTTVWIDCPVAECQRLLPVTLPVEAHLDESVAVRYGERQRVVVLRVKVDPQPAYAVIRGHFAASHEGVDLPELPA